MKLYVARDKNGKLYLYSTKPSKLANGYWVEGRDYSELDKNLFPEMGRYRADRS